MSAGRRRPARGPRRPVLDPHTVGVRVEQLLAESATAGGRPRAAAEEVVRG